MYGTSLMFGQKFTRPSQAQGQEWALGYFTWRPFIFFQILDKHIHQKSTKMTPLSILLKTSMTIMN